MATALADLRALPGQSEALLNAVLAKRVSEGFDEVRLVAKKHTTAA